METIECPRYRTCEKMELVMSIDGDNYDTVALARDVCQLCGFNAASESDLAELLEFIQTSY